MTPFQQDQLLDQVRANGNWVEPVENGLTLDGHFQLADLRKLVLVLEARETAIQRTVVVEKAIEERHILDRDAPGLYQAAVTEGPQITLTADQVSALLKQRKVSFQDYLARVEALFMAAGNQCSRENWNPRIWRVVGSRLDAHVVTADGKRPL